MKLTTTVCPANSHVGLGTLAATGMAYIRSRATEPIFYGLLRHGNATIHGTTAGSDV